MSTKKSYAPSIAGTGSIYSMATTVRTGMSRSVKSLRVPWYKKPIVQDAVITDIQNGANYNAIFCVFVSLFTIATAIFDIYCLGMVYPGVRHYGFFIMNFQFVYVGNRHVRNCLIVFALFSFIAAVALLVTSVIFLKALRKENEKKIVPWLYCGAIFYLWRLFAFIFATIVNDMIFAYNIMMCLLWIFIILAGAYGWIVSYSLYLDLCDLTRLEDIAHLRMGTMSSLNVGLSSRPTTPFSTVSTSHMVL
ncbi:uncharacterized protein LOC136038867 isoform X1 [Artemia franciscana]|uniref:EOG090X0DL4 n=2 Tax=Artemia franciscana TaxID=6661 RepID=A0AA88I0R6_ARTSF|nr:hypothetical protein QYM36_006628 [Artemia franciscana]